MRIRTVLAVAALLALSACARHSAPAPTPSPADTQATPPTPATPPPAEARSARSETEQATASQESVDGDGDTHDRSDASLEKIAGAAAGAQLPSGKVEVMEVFWLACPHCYELEPHIRSWLKSKPAYVEFVRVPVIWQDVHRAHARLFYTLEALGRDDLVETAFDTIHEDIGNRIPPLVGQTEEETFRLQQQFAVQHGISAADFARAYNDFGVSSNLQHAEEITQRYHVQSVPFFVVGGKYSTDVAKAGSESRLFELLNDLAASEHTHRGQ